MLKKLYIMAWILLVVGAFATVVTDNINPTIVLVISVMILGLGYGIILREA